MGASCLAHQKTRLHNLANWLLLAFRRIRNWSIVLLSIQLLQQNRAYKNVMFFFFKLASIGSHMNGVYCEIRVPRF